jgi:hypothetical protein
MRRLPGVLLSSLHGEQTGSVKDQEGRTKGGKLALIVRYFLLQDHFSLGHEGA